MRHMLLLGFAILIVGVAVVAVAQQPTTPPATLPKMPSTPMTAPTANPTPLSATDVPLNRFDPLTAFPHETQSAVRAVVTGSNWMARMSQPQGRFLFGYNPALRQSLLGDHDLKQAQGALALAQAAKFSGDEKQATIAAQTLLTLMAATRLDPADVNCRVPGHSSLTCNRVGFAATLALAIYELPAADAKLVAEAERLCNFLLKQCKPDGSVHYTDGATDEPAKIDPGGVNEYPGLALQALAVSHRVKPTPAKAEAVKKGVEFYRAAFRAQPHPMLAATLTPACLELYVQTKAQIAATTAFELNDWLCALQIPPTDARTPQWVGGFRTVMGGQQTDAPPGIETGRYVESLACACQLARLVPDLARFEKYKGTALDATRFLCGMQYAEANTRHFENTFRANMLIGAFHVSATDGTLRIDATATAVTGLLRFLGSGAEK